MPRLDFSVLRGLLRRRIDDPLVISVLGEALGRVQRIDAQAFVDLKEDGVSVMFKEGPQVVPGANYASRELRVAAFHFHVAGHEGHSRYVGLLPGGVCVGESRMVVSEKLGEPHETGGGGYSAVLRRPIPQWLRYFMDGDILQFQLDADGRVEMATWYASQERAN